MLLRIFVGLLLALLPASGVVVTGADAQDEQKITATLALLSKAMVEKDVVALRNILHDDMTYGHSGGLVQDKANIIEVTRTRGVDRWTFKTAKITVADRTALVRANIVFSTAVEGYRNDAVTDAAPNVLLVFVRGGGPHGWRLIARQNFVGLLRSPEQREPKR
jgi:hypothetical protein